MIRMVPYVTVFLFVLIVVHCTTSDSNDVPSFTPTQTAIPRSEREPTRPYWIEKSQEIKPSQRYFHAMAYDSNRKVTVLFGGKDVNGAKLNDTWEYSSHWRKVETASKPPERWKAGMTYDPSRNKIVLFGGQNQDIPGIADYNDTWEYDGTDWLRIDTNHKPEKRFSHPMTWDGNLQGVLIFGGECSDDYAPYLFTTWKYDGVDWVLLDVNKPTDLAGAGSQMVYDPLRRKTILYGGEAGIEYYNKTWEFDGRTLTWERKYPTHNPGPLSFYGMAYDSTRGKIVIFAGVRGIASEVDKTWEYDGVDWIRIETQNIPHTRYSHSMTYDSMRNKVIMFGGSGDYGATKFDDTWEYGGPN